MLRLLLLRHAEASAASAGGDMNRPLTAAGKAAAGRIGAYLKGKNVVPELALVSPSRRTIETMDEVNRALGERLPNKIAALLYNATLGQVQDLVSQTQPGIRSLLLIGHNPSLGEAAAALARSGAEAELGHMRSQFPAPSLAVIAFDEDEWPAAVAHGGRLDGFVTAPALQLLQRGR